MSNKALLVGINKYKLPGSDLQGCVNDVTNVRDLLLKYFGFGVSDIRVITDERATKEAILDGLKWLAGGAKAADRLLFHYSGHGSQIRDVDGDEPKDRLDEILCPHDMDWDEKFITDDELQKVFSTLPKGNNLEVLLDSCHSGTGTREALGIKGLPAELSFRPRFLPPPVDIECRVEDELEVRRLFRKSNPVSYVFFSACKENQTSADACIDGNYNGAFTYYFCKHIRSTQGRLIRSELLKRTRVSLRFNGFGQIPQLESPREELAKMFLG